MYISHTHTQQKQTDGMDCLNKNGMEQIFWSPYIAALAVKENIVVSPISQADH